MAEPRDRDDLSDLGLTKAQARVIRNALKLAINRCHNPNHPNYHQYGGRGISVCDEWRGVGRARRFAKHIGPRPDGHSLDRIDNDRGYEPGNVRWANRREQCGNRRTSRELTVDGETHTVAEWARRSGLPAATIANRLSAGWPAFYAVSAPRGSDWNR